MNLQRLLFLPALFLITFGSKSFTQNLFVSPEITIGYTLGASLNVGFNIDFGIEQNSVTELRYGGSYGMNISMVNKELHRQTTLNFLLENKYFDIKLGPARMRNNWGYNKNNRCIIYGFTSDISLKYPNTYSPKIGYRNFIYRKHDWAWFHMNYHTVYLGVEYNNEYL